MVSRITPAKSDYLRHQAATAPFISGEASAAGRLCSNGVTVKIGSGTICPKSLEKSMDEQEFDSLFSVPFGTEDAMRIDARGRRFATLGSALWGKTVDDLERNLLAPHPEIPLGFDLADFQELQLMAQRILLYLSNPRSAWISTLPPRTIIVGSARYTEWEARCEIVRRAIEHL
jgi:hypothetical protein